MKQGKLIRRAVSAALAGCMMFTFSAPALAESTDALMQLSMTRRSAVSVLDAENGDTVDYGITITITGREVKVDSDNCNNILGFLKYDPDEQKLTLLKSNASAVNYLTIDAPNTDVVLESTEMIVSNNLLIENARSVKVSSTGNWAPVYGKVYIYCACPVTLEHTEAGANSGVAISGIEFAAPVNASDFVYYTSDAPDATPTDAGTETIPARTENYLRIVPKVSYTITADDATITVDGKAVTSAFAGEKVTVTAAGRKNAEFTGWTDLDSVLTSDQLTAKEVTFTMPDKNVTLTPNYNVVQDYGLEVGSENTTPTRVTSKNCKDILNKGVLSYDPTTQTLKSNGKLPRSLQKINAPGKDINLDGKDQIAVAAKLIVVKAHNVTISSDEYDAIFSRGDTSTINCTGKVDIRSDKNRAVNGSLNIYDSSEVILSAGYSVVTDNANITSEGNVTIESTDGRAAKNLTINKADNVTVIINDTQAISENTQITASGTVILKNNAQGGPVGTVTFTQAKGKNYVYYTSEGADEGAIDASVTPIPSDVPYRYLRIEEKQNARIKVNNGTVTVGDTTEAQLDSFKGQKVKVTATGAESDDRKFDGWEVVAPDGFTIDADKLREKSFEFIMPAGEVELTAHYASKLSVTGGTAEVNGNAVDFARPDADVTVTATDRSADGYQFDHWVVSGGDIGKTEEELKANPLKFTMPDAAVKLTAVYRAAVTVVNGIAEAGTESGETIFVLQGEKVTVSGKNRNPDVTKFGGWKVVSPEGFELTEEQKNTEKNMTFTMPASPVELKASYSFPAPVLDMQVTVKGGTIRVGEGESQTGTVFVQPGQTVTIEANEPAKENESFHHWKVEKDSSKNIGIIEGSLGSETEKGTEKIVFTMPQDGVKLTAVYSIPASVLRSTVTVTGGTAKSTLGEGSDIPAEIGTTVEITATPYDAEKYPGMEFVEWEIKYPDSFYEKFPGGIPENLQLKLDNAKSAATTFEMPVYPVKLIAHWSASPVAKPDPDEPIDEDFGVEPAPMDTTGGTIAAVAVGGAAIWGGYEIATRVILNDLLPEGAAIPANRGQLALLIWTEKGKPEPAAQPAFADITDAELAKAAQWCVEQGLLDAREGKFESDGWMPKFKTIEIWNKAFPKK